MWCGDVFKVLKRFRAYFVIKMFEMVAGVGLFVCGVAGVALLLRPLICSGIVVEVLLYSSRSDTSTIVAED